MQFVNRERAAAHGRRCLVAKMVSEGKSHTEIGKYFGLSGQRISKMYEQFLQCADKGPLFRRTVLPKGTDVYADFVNGLRKANQETLLQLEKEGRIL